MVGILAISGLHCEAPRGDHPRLPPYDCPPRKTRTICANTRELMNKLPGNWQFRAPEGWGGRVRTRVLSWPLLMLAVGTG